MPGHDARRGKLLARAAELAGQKPADQTAPLAALLGELRTSFHSDGRSDATANAVYRAALQQEFPQDVIELADRLKPTNATANYFEVARGIILRHLVKAHLYSEGPLSIADLEIKTGYAQAIIRSTTGFLKNWTLNTSHYASELGKAFTILIRSRDTWELVRKS